MQFAFNKKLQIKKLAEIASFSVDKHIINKYNSITN